ncbi:hypothetical protein [Methanoregula sp.]|uniref:hypothetical protein n=1 Tax=Methanoregula sp. TaxID=2052170 RepID=UPI003C7534B8
MLVIPDCEPGKTMCGKMAMGNVIAICEMFPLINRYFHGVFTNRFFLTVISVHTGLVANTDLISVAQKNSFTSAGGEA